MGPEGVITNEERTKFGMPQLAVMAGMFKKKKPMKIVGNERELKKEGKLVDPNQRRIHVGANAQGGT